MPLSKEVIELIKESEKKATPGKWLCYADYLISTMKNGEIVTGGLEGDGGFSLVDDRDLIVLVKNNLSSLLSAAEWAIETGWEDKTKDNP